MWGTSGLHKGGMFPTSGTVSGDLTNIERNLIGRERARGNGNLANGDDNLSCPAYLIPPTRTCVISPY